MGKYQVQIELHTDTVLGNGEDLPGVVDIEAQYDKYGFPYLKAKTIKGLIREQMVQLSYAIENISGRKLSEEIKEMLGWSDRDLPKIKFTDAVVSEEITRKCLDVRFVDLKPEEILRALTVKRSFTEIGSDGVAKDHSLRSVRLINKGLVLFSDLFINEPLSEIQDNLLSASVKSVRHIGTMKSKGRGEVVCSLLKNGIELNPKAKWYKLEAL